MSDDDIDYDSTEYAIRRARDTGSLWLNSIFVVKDRSRRLFGKRGPRISALEALWGAICMILVAGILIPGYFYIGTWGPLFALFHPVSILGWSLVAGWQGRKIAHMSPLRRKTGEGMLTYLFLLVRQGVTRVSFLMQRPVMYNQCLSIAGNNERDEEVVECIEWIGTARIPYAPYNYDPKRHADLQEQGESLMTPVFMPPRGKSVPLSDRQRQRIRDQLDPS